MTISPTSRYIQGESLWVKTTSRGNKQTVYLNTMIVMTAAYSAVISREDDNMMLYANRTFGDPYRWWQLADVNPPVFYPLDIIPGQQLRLPA